MDRCSYLYYAEEKTEAQKVKGLASPSTSDWEARTRTWDVRLHATPAVILSGVTASNTAWNL